MDSAITFPVDADEFDIDLSIFADRINQDAGGGIIGCGNLSFDLSIRASIVPTDYAWVGKERVAFHAACLRGTRISTKRRDLDDYLEDLEDSFTEFERAQVEVIEASILANDSVPSRVCLPDGSIDGIQVEDIARAKFRFELTPSADRNEDSILLLGISSVDGHDLGAHDTLLDVSRVRVDNVASTGCLPFVQQRIVDNIRSTLREQLPTALRDQVLDQLSLDPAIFFPRREHVACETDADCDFTSANGAVYQTTDGEWRGGRHICRTRDAQRAGAIDPLLEFLVGAQQPGDFCHFTIEPERFNVRPSGFEVVLLDSFEGDPQGGIIEDNILGDLVRQALCLPDRAGAPLAWRRGPERSARPNQFSFTGP